jgi:hypothetical protein
MITSATNTNFWNTQTWTLVQTVDFTFTETYVCRRDDVVAGNADYFPLGHLFPNERSHNVLRDPITTDVGHRQV